MSPLLDMQRRVRELGRIRIGMLVQGANGKMRPEKLDTFRLTSPSEQKIRMAAELFGGEAIPWDRSRESRASEWQVFTTSKQLHVIVPPDETLTQHYELWSGGGVQRRCDSVTRTTGEPCICPRDQAARAQLAAENPPAACKPHSRLSVMIADLPDLGVWTLASTGMNAAVEWGGTISVLERKRADGVFLPAQIRLEQRTSKQAGLTRQFAVVVVEIEQTLRQLAGGNIPELPPPPPRLQQLEGGATRAVEATPAALLPDNPDQLARMAMTATDHTEVVAIGKHARTLGILDDLVDPDGSDILQPLNELLLGRIEQLTGSTR